MTVPRVPAAAVSAGAALGRADTKDELESIWLANGCDAFRGAARTYLMGIYRGVCARLDRNARNLALARAI
jgi:hypothetical protein